MTNAVELPKGSLAELTDHLQALFDTLEMIDDPETKREAEAEIGRYLEAEVRKVDAVSGYLSKCAAEATFLRSETVRLRERIDMWEARAQRVRAYVQHVMEKWNERKLEGRTATFYLRAATPSVVITDEALVPDEFKQTVVTVTIDKRALKKAIEAGRDVPGADLAIGGQALVHR